MIYNLLVTGDLGSPTTNSSTSSGVIVTSIRLGVNINYQLESILDPLLHQRQCHTR